MTPVPHIPPGLEILINMSPEWCAPLLWEDMPCVTPQKIKLKFQPKLH